MPFISHAIATPPPVYSITLGGSTSPTNIVRWYEVQGDYIKFINTTTVQASGSVSSGLWNNSGNSMAVPGSLSPGVYIYNRTGTNFTRILGTPVIPSVGRMDWSPDGNSLMVGSIAAPYVFLLNRSGDTFTLTTSTPWTSSGVFTVSSEPVPAWSPDGKSVAFAIRQAGGINLVVFNRTGTDTFSLISTSSFVGGLPTGGGYTLAWNQDGSSIAHGGPTSPYITIYNRSGDTFTKLSNPATLPTGAVFNIDWSPDGGRLLIGTSVVPRFYAYNRSGNTFTKIATPAQQPANNVTGLKISGTGDLVVYGVYLNPSIYYRFTGTATYTLLNSPVNNTSYPQQVGIFPGRY
jgi:hypothetical protein